MADFQDMRARIRDTGYQPEPSRSGLPFWIVTAFAVTVGFTIVLLAPRFYTVQRTAELPTFKEMLGRTQATATVQNAPVPEAPASAGRYAGKGADDIAKIADSICMPSTPTGPTGLTFQSDRLYCLLTEGPGRYCTSSQRSKITAAIINHFRIVEHAAKVAKIEVEPRLLVAIEGLIRAGYLLKPQREDIAASVPREIKERFARVVGNKPPCPDPPWWAVWK